MPISFNTGLSGIMHKDLLSIQHDTASEERDQEIQELYSKLNPIYGAGGIYTNLRACVILSEYKNIATMEWLSLYQCISGVDKRLNIQVYSKGYTNEQVGEIDHTMDLFYNLPSHNDTLTIRSLYIKRGLAACEKFKESYTRRSDAWRYLDNTSRALVIDQRHQIHVFYNAETQTIDIISSKPYAAFHYRLLATLIKTLPELSPVLRVTEDSPNSPAKHMKELCTMFYKQNGDDWLAYLHTLADQTEDMLNERRFETLNNYITQFAEAQQAQLKESIQSEEAAIRDYEQTVERHYQELTELQRMLTAYMTGQNDTDAQLKSFANFIKQNKAIINIRSMQKNGNRANSTVLIGARINTPIGNYRRADANLWFKRTETNYVNRNAKVATVFKACFVDETWQMLTSTNVEIRLSTDKQTNFARGLNDMENFGNQHVARYNCFSNAKTAMSKAIIKGDYLQALMFLIQACGTYTFTDSTVVSQLTNKMASYQGKVYRKMNTTELYTLTEAAEIINNGQTAPVEAGTTVIITSDPDNAVTVTLNTEPAAEPAPRPQPENNTPFDNE